MISFFFLKKKKDAHDVPIAPDPLYEAGDNDCVINARMVSDKAEVGLRRWTVGYSASEGIDKDMFCHHWKWGESLLGEISRNQN